jgi:hypothetical protein
MYWQCIAAAGAAAFGTFIGGASMAYSLTYDTNLFLNMTMMISLSAATAGIVVAGGGSALPTFSATTSVAVIVGAACLYNIGEMFLNQRNKSLAPGICAVVLGATAVHAGLAYTAASVVIYAAPITSLLGSSDDHRFSGLCATICALAASNAFYIGALARVHSHSILSILGAAIGGATGAAAGAYICGASFFVTAAAAAGVISGFLFINCHVETGRIYYEDFAELLADS